MKGRGRPRGLTVWVVSMSVMLAAVGLLFATSEQRLQGTGLRSGHTALIEFVRSQDRLVRQRAAAVQRLQDQVDALTAQQAPKSAGVASLRAAAAKLAPVVGTQAVTGPALTVTLDDAKLTGASLPEGFSADDIVVHQQDVQNVVNALWAGGAEAMMLMDQRVISTSAVRCVGNTLILQGRVYSPPYVIQAIGDQSAMRKALVQSPQIRIYLDYVEELGLGYDVTSKSRASFPAYAGSLRLSYARTLVMATPGGRGFIGRSTRVVRISVRTGGSVVARPQHAVVVTTRIPNRPLCHGWLRSLAAGERRKVDLPCLTGVRTLRSFTRSSGSGSGRCLPFGGCCNSSHADILRQQIRVRGDFMDVAKGLGSR